MSSGAGGSAAPPAAEASIGRYAMSCIDGVSKRAAAIAQWVLQEQVMTKFGNNVIAVIMISALAALLPGPRKPEGPLEKAGRAANNVVERIGASFDRAGDKIKDAATK